MDLTGADQSAYTIEPVEMGHQGSYTCLVTDEFNAEFVESDAAMLTVLAGMPLTSGLGLMAAVLAAGLLGALRLRRRIK
jgi:homoserine kinase